MRSDESVKNVITPAYEGNITLFECIFPLHIEIGHVTEIIKRGDINYISVGNKDFNDIDVTRRITPETTT